MEPIVTRSCFIIGPEDTDWVEALVKEINVLGSESEPLRNVTFIRADILPSSPHQHNFKGVEKALELANEFPEKKFILYSFFSPEKLAGLCPFFDVATARSNVRYVEAPCSPGQFIDAAKSFDMPVDEIGSIPVAEKLDAYVKNQVGIIWHAFSRVVDPFRPVTEAEKICIQDGIKGAKRVFPSMKNADDETILLFLKETSADREEVKKDVYFPGVFCDVEGTLFNDRILNKSVLSFLQIKVSEGLEVTLWTDGDLAEIKNLLDATDIHFPLCAKRDFAGAYVKIAIDDLDQNAFVALTKIHPLHFLSPNSL